MAARSQFKVEPGQESLIQVELLTEGVGGVWGHVVRISAEGVQARFPAETCPGLALGAKARLRFIGVRLVEPVIAQVSVQTRGEDDHARRYGFWFVQRAEVEQRLLPHLHGLFDRRGTVRVTPEPTLPIVVTLESEPRGGRVRANLFDISDSGMAIRVNPDDDRALAPYSRARVSFLLQGALEATVRLGVIIRQRRMQGRQIHLGLEFEPCPSPEAQPNYWAVRDYVSKRAKQLQSDAAAAARRRAS